MRTPYLQLPFQFNVKNCVSELMSVSEKIWISHYNNMGYEGRWTCISLMGKEGDEESIIVPTDNSSIAKPSKALSLLPSFFIILNTFDTPIISARLMNLHSGAFIKPHTDYNMGYENGTIRLHIPIITNPDVSFILDGDKLNMKPGECWYTNVNFIHSVRNDGEYDRIHLVMDLQRNKWIDSIFFSLVSPKSLLEEYQPSYDIATIRKMISELRRNTEPAAKKLIIELEKQIPTHCHDPTSS